MHPAATSPKRSRVFMENLYFIDFSGLRCRTKCPTKPDSRPRSAMAVNQSSFSCPSGTNSLLVQLRPYNHSLPRKFASYSRVTSRGRPSVGKPIQDCKRFPSLSRPWLRSRAQLLRVASLPDQTYPIRGNIAQVRSSLSTWHSDSAGRAATAAGPPEAVPHSSNARPIQNEIADRSDCARPASAPPRLTFPPVAFWPRPVRRSFALAARDRSYYWR